MIIKDLDLNRRIIYLLEYFTMNKNQFAIKIGVAAQTIGDIVELKTNPGRIVINQILNAFPEVNPNWLRQGEGPKIIQSTTNELRPNNECEKCKKLNEELALKCSEIERLQKKIIDLYELNPGILIPSVDREANTG